MTEKEIEELQEICNRIQSGERNEDWYPLMNRVDNKGKHFYSSVFIYGETYMIDLNRKITIKNDLDI